MFGYVRPLEPELKVREAASYKAHYCALCKAIGARYGLFARNLLSYDCTFLALLLCAREPVQKANREICVANPFVKKPVMPRNEMFGYAAAVNVFMAYGKLEDDWRDDKRLSALTGKAALSGAYKKAFSLHPGLGQAVRSGLSRLGSLESALCDIMDEASDAFGAMLAEVFAFPADGRERPAMEWLGYNLGKWIYIMDAFDDIDKDYAKNRYNVLLRQFPGAPGVTRAASRERVYFNLTRSLSEAEKALSLLKLQSQQGLVQNILIDGCGARMDAVLAGRSANGSL